MQIRANENEPVRRMNQFCEVIQIVPYEHFPDRPFGTTIRLWP